MKFKDTLYTMEDIIPIDEISDCIGMIIVLHPKSLNENHRIPQYQIWRATGGFGTKVDTIGTALFAECLLDGEHARWRRYDFMGVLKEDLVKELELEG